MANIKPNPRTVFRLLAIATALGVLVAMAAPAMAGTSKSHWEDSDDNHPLSL